MSSGTYFPPPARAVEIPSRMAPAAAGHYLMAGRAVDQKLYISRIAGMPREPNVSPQTVRLLQALLEQPAQWHYGYELSKQTGLSSGTLYPILMRLADQHLLETRWEPPQRPGRPARHNYRLTAAGQQLALDRAARPASARRLAPARPIPDGAR